MTRIVSKSLFFVKFSVSILLMIERKGLNILVVGGGGREHAIGTNISKSQLVREVRFAPGNGGTAEIGLNLPIEATDTNELIFYAETHDIGLTIVGPERPLVNGIVDAFKARDLPIFGPTREAAQLEGSKAYSALLADRLGIPQPKFAIYTNESAAKRYIESLDYDVVVKADGLADGKGVIVPDDKEEAMRAVDRVLKMREFGDAGSKIVLQEKLVGTEFSVLAFVDGRTIIPLKLAQDHKRLQDNGQGPNTGGMGTFSPVSANDKARIQETYRDFLRPIVEGMYKEKNLFEGVIFLGMMETEEGNKLLEINVRCGDPEIQSLISRIDSDLVPVFVSTVEGRLINERIHYREGAAVCVVLASGGYPEKNYRKGDEIHGLGSISDPDVQIFHAGTKREGETVVTNGGRVLGVTAFSENVEMAANKAYSVIGSEGIRFDGMQYRTDIGRRAQPL